MCVCVCVHPAQTPKLKEKKKEKEYIHNQYVHLVCELPYTYIIYNTQFVTYLQTMDWGELCSALKAVLFHSLTLPLQNEFPALTVSHQQLLQPPVLSE